MQQKVPFMKLDGVFIASKLCTMHDMVNLQHSMVSLGEKIRLFL